MPRQSESQLVIFDVCDTLYDSNTTFGFLRFHADSSGNSELRRTLRRWTSLKSPWGLLGAVALRLLGVDIPRARAIGALRGEARSALEQSARAYVETELPARTNAAVHERLRRHLGAGDRVVLVSSSLDIVIAEIARVLGVEFLASTLGFEGELCTGRLQRDLTGRKAEAIAALRDGTDRMHVYTDNRSDRDLLGIADRRTVIIPSGSPPARWAGTDCEYVTL